MKILNGRETSEEVKKEIKIEVEEFSSNQMRAPHLAAILVGNNGASETYVNAKVKACKKVGFNSTLVRLDDLVTEEELCNEIKLINKDNDIDGLIVQLPLPKHLNEQLVTHTISSDKDVDGFHPNNIGRMVLGLDTFLPATPAGILELLKRYQVPTLGKKCVIVGRSNIVGSPLSILMSKNNYPGNCTVTLAHSKTKNLKEICLEADILVSAIGIPNFITSEMVKKGCCVIDVGITRTKSTKTKSGWKLNGDVDYKNVSEKCSYITPVPGGVGPMTIAMLLKNTLVSYKRKMLL